MAIVVHNSVVVITESLTSSHMAFVYPRILRNVSRQCVARVDIPDNAIEAILLEALVVK